MYFISLYVGYSLFKKQKWDFTVHTFCNLLFYLIHIKSLTTLIHVCYLLIMYLHIFSFFKLFFHETNFYEVILVYLFLLLLLDFCTFRHLSYSRLLKLLTLFIDIFQILMILCFFLRHLEIRFQHNKKLLSVVESSDSMIMVSGSKIVF